MQPEPGSNDRQPSSKAEGRASTTRGGWRPRTRARRAFLTHLMPANPDEYIQVHAPRWLAELDELLKACYAANKLGIAARLVIARARFVSAGIAPRKPYRDRGLEATKQRRERRQREREERRRSRVF